MILSIQHFLSWNLKYKKIIRQIYVCEVIYIHIYDYKYNGLIFVLTHIFPQWCEIDIKSNLSLSLTFYRLKKMHNARFLPRIFACIDLALGGLITHKDRRRIRRPQYYFSVTVFFSFFFYCILALAYARYLLVHMQGYPRHFRIYIYILHHTFENLFLFLFTMTPPY